LRTCSEAKKGHESDGMRAESPIERPGCWVGDVGHGVLKFDGFCLEGDVVDVVVHQEHVRQGKVST
jgi:hypothetical protein